MLLTQRLLERFASFGRSARHILYVIAPYAHRAALERVVDQRLGIDVVVVTTWRTEDVLRGSSDLEVYSLCKIRGWFLYVHPSLHAKLLVADLERALLTSANMTRRALGLVQPANVECGVEVPVLSNEDLLWLSQVVADSCLVDEAYFQAFSRHVERQNPHLGAPAVREFDANSLGSNRHFLLSSLPMTDSPAVLLDSIAEIRRNARSLPSGLRACVLHDAALYGLHLDSDRGENERQLRLNFFRHPFIVAFEEFIQPRRFFGESKAWIQRTCADVPVPRRRDLTGHVRVLFDWLEELSDGRFIVNRPHYSECIVRADTEKDRR